MSTNAVKISDVKRDWKIVDAKGKILGRLAVEVANLLVGKSKTNYVSYLDMGDYVVVINASLIKISGKKADQKTYYRHSMFRGGLKHENYSDLLVRRPDEVIRHAVKGMVPNNKLKAKWLKKLFIYADDKHPYERNFSQSKKEDEQGAVAAAA